VSEPERGPSAPGRRARSSVRLLVAALALQLLLAGLLIWAVAGGSTALRDLVGGGPSRVTAPAPTRTAPPGGARATPGVP